MPGILLRNSDGQTISIDDKDRGFYEERGWVEQTPDESFASFKAEPVESDSGVLGTLGMAASSALSGATLGLSDVALASLATEGRRKEMVAEREAHPIISTGANIAGMILPALVAPESLLGRTPAGYLGRAAAEGFEAGRAAGGLSGTARALVATGGEGALQSGGAYLADAALGDRELTAEGMSAALGHGFVFGAAAGGAMLGIERGSIAARRLFARSAEGGERAAQAAESAWERASQETLEANDAAVDVARARLDEARQMRERAGLVRDRAVADEAVLRTRPPAKDPVAGVVDDVEESLGPLVAEYDAARAEFEAMRKRIAAGEIGGEVGPFTDKGLDLATFRSLMRGEADDLAVPVGEFGAPGARGVGRPVEAPRVAAGTGADATAQLKKPKIAEDVAKEVATPDGQPSPTPLSRDEYNAYKSSYSHAATGEHLEAEMFYSKGGDELVNPELRSGKPLSEEAKKLKNGLEAAFSLPEARIPRSVMLYRGVSDNPTMGIVGVKKRFQNVKPGDIIEDPAFTSTSFDEMAKSRNEDIVFTIRAPAGTPALPIRSQFSFEGEMLLPPNTKMRVDRIEEVAVGERAERRAAFEKGGEHVEILPDKSTKITDSRGQVFIQPPIKDIHVSIVGDFKPPANVTRHSIDLSSPIDKLSMRQLGEYQDLLNKEFDRIKSGTPEYKSMSDKWDEVVARRNAISDKKIPAPEHDWVPTKATVEPSSLEQQLAEMQSQLGSGKSLGKLSAESPARAEYVAAKAAKTEADAAHFRAKATGSDLDPFFKNLTAPKTRDAYVAANIGRAMREEGSHAAALAKVEREWATRSGEATTSFDIADTGAVEDIAAMAPVVTRLEKAAADIVEAVGDAAPPVAQEATKAFRKAELEAERKAMDRTSRAIDDAAEAPVVELAAARARKLDAQAAYAQAKAAETEARIGSADAKRVAEQTQKAAETVALPGAPAPRKGKVGIIADIGAALEVADTIGIPGLPHPRDIPVIGSLLSVYLKYHAAKVAINRFAGRVPATGNSKAAALAATTKDRIAMAVDRSLGLVAEAAPKARGPVVAIASALQHRAFDDGEPDAPKDASLGKLAATRIREVTAAAARPDQVIAQVRREMRDVHDPDLIAAAEQHRVRAFTWLADQAPKAPPPNPYTRREWEPSPAAATRFARQYEAVFDPASVFEALHRQSLSLDAAEALRATSPKLFAMAQERLVSRAGDLTKPVPYEQRLRNSKLFDVPLDSSLEPETLAILQSAYEPVTPQQQPAPVGPPMPSIAGPTDLSALYQTDRRSMRQ